MQLFLRRSIMIKNISLTLASILALVAFASCGGGAKFDLSPSKQAGEAYLKSAQAYKAAVEAAADAPALVKAISDFSTANLAFLKVGAEQQKKMMEFAKNNANYVPSAEDTKIAQDLQKLATDAAQLIGDATLAITAKAFGTDPTVIQAQADMAKAVTDATTEMTK